MTKKNEGTEFEGAKPEIPPGLKFERRGFKKAADEEEQAPEIAFDA